MAQSGLRPWNSRRAGRSYLAIDRRLSFYLVSFLFSYRCPQLKIKRLFILALFAVVARLGFGYVREFDDNGTPVGWVWDRTVVMQLSLGTGNRTLRDGFTSFNDSAIDALQTWNPYLAHLRFSWVKNSPVTPAKGDDEISVIFDNKVF